MKSKIDLHMHCNASDGSDTVPELLEKIKTMNITTFALTDHDTMKGALEMEKLVPPGIRFIRGIELSCVSKVAKCHILGYAYDPGNTELQMLVKELHEIRKNKTHNRFRFLTDEFGFEFTEEERRKIEIKESPGKPDFKELIEKKLREANPGGKAVNIYETYFKHLPDGRIDAIHAIKAVKAAGGVAVWAHPLGGTGEKRLTESQFRAQLDLLCSVGLDGLECHYSEYTKKEVATLCHAANEKGLRISCGSDYHGTKKPHLHLGMLNKEDAIIREEQLTVLDAFCGTQRIMLHFRADALRSKRTP